MYLAIQAALAFGHETVDIGWLMGTMLADGRRTADATCEPLGAGGLAYFHWLYEVELASVGDADYHHYRFRRRHDGAQTIAYLCTTPVPRSLQAHQEYERAQRSLADKRKYLLTTYRPKRQPN